MASLETRNGRFRIVFRIDGQKFTKSLKTDDESFANICLAKAEHRLSKYRLGILTIPSDKDPTDFIFGLNGRPPSQIGAEFAASLERLMTSSMSHFEPSGATVQ